MFAPARGAGHDTEVQHDSNSGVITLDPGRRARHASEFVRDWSGAAVASGVAGALALLAIALGWRGSDLPAQLFRVELFHRAGFVVWDNQWFSGVPTLGYSVLFPVLGALTGPVALGVASGVGSAFLFQRLVHRAFGSSAWVGSVWFAASTATNLVVGRVTFALGIVFLLGALLALQHHRLVLAVPCALLCGLASPVAGVFLVVITGGWGLARRPERTAAWLTGAIGITPVLVIAALFPSPGSQPYEWWALGCDLALCALFWMTVPEKYSALRYGAAVYAVVLIATKIVASPLGGNVSRLNQYAAGPLLACALWEYRRKLVIVLAVPLIFWQWFPAFDTMAFARTDPSTHRAYYQPLVQYLTAQGQMFGRVEIPDTYRHWEAAYVAPQFSLARGWERQLDYAYDADFYNNTLVPSAYENWLAQNGVEYVALPDAATRLFVVRRSATDQERIAIPPTRVAQRGLAGLSLPRIPRPRRWPRTPHLAQHVELQPPGQRTGSRDRAYPRLVSLGGARRRMHHFESRPLDRAP